MQELTPRRRHAPVQHLLIERVTKRVLHPGAAVRPGRHADLHRGTARRVPAACSRPRPRRARARGWPRALAWQSSLRSHSPPRADRGPLPTVAADESRSSRGCPSGTAPASVARSTVHSQAPPRSSSHPRCTKSSRAFSRNRGFPDVCACSCAASSQRKPMVGKSAGEIRSRPHRAPALAGRSRGTAPCCQLVLQLGDRVLLRDGIGRTIARHIIRCAGSRRAGKGGERADGRMITPMQILEQEHQRAVERELLDEAQQLAHHALVARPGERAAQFILLTRLQQLRQLQQPRRRQAAQERDRVPAGRLAAQPFQRFEQRHVRVARTVTVDALAAREKNGLRSVRCRCAAGGEPSDKRVQHGRFADSRLTGDEDRLRLPPAARVSACSSCASAAWRPTTSCGVWASANGTLGGGGVPCSRTRRLRATQTLLRPIQR